MGPDTRYVRPVMSRVHCNGILHTYVKYLEFGGRIANKHLTVVRHDVKKPVQKPASRLIILGRARFEAVIVRVVPFPESPYES